MAENPEAIILLVSHNNGSETAADAMRRQINVHEETNQDKTVLDKMVEAVWHKDDQTLADLKSLQQTVNLDLQHNDTAAVAKLDTQIKSAVKADENAMQTQNSVEFYSGSFLKAVPLFAGKNKLLMAASIGFNAMDAVHMKDSGGQVAADLALGGLKGFALKQTFDMLGAKTFSVGAEGSALAKTTSILGVGGKGVVIGGLSRVYDAGLNRQNWVDDKGNTDAGKAMSMAVGSALDWRAMGMDAALFMGGHGVFSGLAKVGSKAVEASPLLQKFESSAAGNFVKDAKIIPGATMGATFGFASGATGEAMREHQNGENFDLGKVMKRGGLQALTDGAAGATGAGATRLSDLNLASNAKPIEKVVAGKMGMAFAGDDELPEIKPATAASIDLRVDEALKPVLEKAVNLASAAVKPGASAESVIDYFKYAAGDGAHVRGHMEQVAEQARQVSNPAMEVLIKRGYETTPEVAATLDQGLQLAELASRKGSSPDQQRAFLDYAYGEGKNSEVPLRIAAELSDNPRLNHELQEAYAGANKLQRHPTDLSPISISHFNEAEQNAFRSVLGTLPDNAESHFLFKQNLNAWMTARPQYNDVLTQYASQTQHGIVAAVVDGRLGTNYLSRFADRNLTGGDLLGKLRDFDTHRAVAPDIEVEPDNTHTMAPPAENQPVAVDAPVEAAKPNPFEPAITHLADGKSVNVPALIAEFETLEGSRKQARAGLLSDFVGQMTDQQFATWYSNGISEANRPDVPAGTNNFALMHIPGTDVLSRPEVINAFNDPEHAAIDFRTLKDFLSAPVQANDSVPAWQTGFITDRIVMASEKLALTPAPIGEDGQPIPADPSKVIKDAIPSWFLKSIRDRYSTFDKTTGSAVYPHDFDDNLAQMLENQRLYESQNPKFRPSTLPSNSFADRVANLEKALDVQKTTTAPDLVPQVLKLGIADPNSVRAVLDKLNLETNAPEYTELLKDVVPGAKNIQDVKTLLDAMYFGKKSESTAFKARKDGKSAEFAEKDRDNNLALALTVARQLVPPGELNSARVQKIVADVINGKIRDPRPDMPGGFGAPGGRGGPGGTGAARAPREFRPRQNPPVDDRPAREPGKVVQADQSGQPDQVVQPVQQFVQETQMPPPPVPEIPQSQEAVVEHQGSLDLSRGAADETDHHQALTGPTPIEAVQVEPLKVDIPPAGAPMHIADVDLTPVIDATGAIDKPGHTEARIIPSETVSEPAPGRKGGRNQTNDYDDQDRPLKGTGKKGRGNDGRGHRERGGAKADRYSRDLSDYGDD